MPQQELFEYFKSTNSYTSAREKRSAAARQGRRRRKIRDDTKKRQKQKRPGLDGLTPVSSGFNDVGIAGLLQVPAAWLSAVAILLVATTLLMGSYLLGRSHGTTLTTSAPAGNGSGVFKPGGKNDDGAESTNGADRNGSPRSDKTIYSVLVRALDDTEKNEDLAIDIQENLEALGFPNCEAVFHREFGDIRVYVGRYSDKNGTEIKSWLNRIRKTFTDATIVER